MEKRRLKIFVVGVLIAITFLGLTTRCDDDDDSKPSVKYSLGAIASSGVSGTVTFTKQSATETLITVQLTGTVAGGVHPAHIHNNPAATGGSIAIDFTDIDGATGKSETLVTELNNGTPITYEELIVFNGYVNIHKSPTELAVLLAQGNIGINADPL